MNEKEIRVYKLNQRAKCFHLLIFFIICFFKDRFYLLIFRERGREGEREGEKHQCASLVPPLVTWPATQACALTGNRTSDPQWSIH